MATPGNTGGISATVESSLDSGGAACTHKLGKFFCVNSLLSSFVLGKRTRPKWLWVLRFAAASKAASPPGFKRSTSEKIMSHTTAAGCWSSTKSNTDAKVSRGQGQRPNSVAMRANADSSISMITMRGSAGAVITRPRTMLS